jgi:predicted nucleotidyltransferase
VVSDELKRLAAVLADWASAAPSARVYLFGSRVRGDHKPTSDVDVFVDFPNADNRDVDWWTRNNVEDFASVKPLLPGPLKVLDMGDPFGQTIKVPAANSLVHRDRNVLCVWMRPKLCSVELTADQRACIEAWAERTPSITAVRIFGSRAKLQARPDSDADLAVTIVGDDTGDACAIFTCERSEWETELTSLLGLRAHVEPYDQDIAPRVFGFCRERHLVLWTRRAA